MQSDESVIFSADVDIDTCSSFNASSFFGWTRASVIDENISPHPCGVYPQPIPVDHLTGLAAMPYDFAELAGYNKIDFLHLAVYDNFTSRQEILELDAKEPKWELLTKASVCPKLFQLAKHHALLAKIKPTSVLELADVLALIRPAKRQYEDLYLAQRGKIRPLLFLKEMSEAYAFKKSHAISYAKVICLQLHLIELNRL